MGLEFHLELKRYVNISMYFVRYVWLPASATYNFLSKTMGSSLNVFFSKPLMPDSVSTNITGTFKFCERLSSCLMVKGGLLHHWHTRCEMKPELGEFINFSAVFSLKYEVWWPIAANSS